MSVSIPNRRALLLAGLSWSALTSLPSTAVAAAVAVPAQASAKEITWDDLISEKWARQVQAEMMALGRVGGLVEDGTPEADRLMSKLRKRWDEAPIVQRYIGQKVRLPGFVVPLDASRDPRREFLLVPYFGACIHTPPPPANQMALIVPQSKAKVAKVFESMETVWVEGVLTADRTTTSQGVTGYRIEASLIEAYEEKKSRRR